jgi:predicted CopG family antitoxin
MGKENPFQNTEQRFVGAYVPPPLADYMRLLCMSGKTSVSSMIQEMLEQKREKQDEYQIIQIIAEQALEEWVRRGETGADQKKAYLKEVERELKRKKISKLHTTLIMGRVKGGI